MDDNDRGARIFVHPLFVRRRAVAPLYALTPVFLNALLSDQEDLFWRVNTFHQPELPN